MITSNRYSLSTRWHNECISRNTTRNSRNQKKPTLARPSPSHYSDHTTKSATNNTEKPRVHFISHLTKEIEAVIAWLKRNFVRARATESGLVRIGVCPMHPCMHAWCMDAMHLRCLLDKARIVGSCHKNSSGVTSKI